MSVSCYHMLIIKETSKRNINPSFLCGYFTIYCIKRIS